MARDTNSRASPFQLPLSFLLLFFHSNCLVFSFPSNFIRYYKTNVPNRFNKYDNIDPNKFSNSSKYKSLLEKLSNLFPSGSISTTVNPVLSKVHFTYGPGNESYFGNRIHPTELSYKMTKSNTNKTVSANKIGKDQYGNTSLLFNLFSSIFGPKTDENDINALPLHKKNAVVKIEGIEKQEGFPIEDFPQDLIPSLLEVFGNLYEYGREVSAVFVLLAVILMHIIALIVSFPMVAVVFAAVYFPGLELDDLYEF